MEPVSTDPVGKELDHADVVVEKLPEDCVEVAQGDVAAILQEIETTSDSMRVVSLMQTHVSNVEIQRAALWAIIRIDTADCNENGVADATKRGNETQQNGGFEAIITAMGTHQDDMRLQLAAILYHTENRIELPGAEIMKDPKDVLRLILKHDALRPMIKTIVKQRDVGWGMVAGFLFSLDKEQHDQLFEQLQAELTEEEYKYMTSSLSLLRRTRRHTFQNHITSIASASVAYLCILGNIATCLTETGQGAFAGVLITTVLLNGFVMGLSGKNASSGNRASCFMKLVTFGINLLTSGTFGFIEVSDESYKNGTKLTQFWGFTWLRLMQSWVLAFSTGIVLIREGRLEGQPNLSTQALLTTWANFLISIGFGTFISVKLAMNGIVAGFGYGHLRSSWNHPRNLVSLVMFQLGNIWSSYAIVPLYYFVPVACPIAEAAVIVGMYICMKIRSKQGKPAQKLVGHPVEDHVLGMWANHPQLAPVRGMMFTMAPLTSYSHEVLFENVISRHMPGLNVWKRVAFDVAVLKLLRWTAVWIVMAVHVVVYAPEQFLTDMEDVSFAALVGIPLLGWLLYGGALLDQWRWGRWAGNVPKSIQVEEKSNLVPVEEESKADVCQV